MKAKSANDWSKADNEREQSMMRTLFRKKKERKNPGREQKESLHILHRQPNMTALLLLRILAQSFPLL